MNLDFKQFKNLEDNLIEDFFKLASIQEEIHEKLVKLSDGKTLKGNEIVGWLGEIYVKMIFNGLLVNDQNEHDVETKEGLKISVKTRRGKNSGWKNTSTIPKIKGSDSPTHLAFVNLKNNYLVNTIWLFKWNDLLNQNLFKQHMVRGNMRGYYFSIDEERDKDHIIYQL